MSNAYQIYYENQVGSGGASGLEVYRGTRYQRGAGIGGVIKGLLKLGLPIFKKAAATIGKRALSTGLEFGGRVANDVMKGKSIKKSLKRRAIESGRGVLHKTVTKPRKRIITKKTATRNTPRDIFT